MQLFDGHYEPQSNYLGLLNKSIMIRGLIVISVKPRERQQNQNRKMMGFVWLEQVIDELADESYQDECYRINARVGEDWLVARTYFT